MKFFVVFACALAAASAGYVHPVVYGAQHLPVIGANGVPVDTAEVQIAKAAHAVHTVDALARNGDLLHGVVAHATPVVSTYASQAAYSAPIVTSHGVAAYPTTAVLPTNINGTPLETPEVVAAKVNHYAAHAEALARNIHAVHYRKRRGVIAAPLAYSTPLVYGAQHLPIIGSNGVPVDTAEVQHAKAAHLAHKFEAHLRNGDYAVAAPVVSAYSYAPVVASTHGAYPHVYSSPLAHYY